MARTNATLVQALLLRDFDTVNVPAINGFIDTASSFIDQVVICVTRKGLSISDSDLELLERWVAAHCYQQSDRGYTSRSGNGKSGSFQGQAGMYFESTFYGQTALTLDNTGCLMNIAKRQVAGGIWLGKTQTESLTYDQRN